jgi:hypothetical protein
MMETVAFYRETIIKTYGFNERTGLNLYQTVMPINGREVRTADLLQRICRGERGVLLLLVRPLSEQRMAFSLLWEPKAGEERGWERLGVGIEVLPWRVEKEVELVYFQGPHYGDRFGIACAALEAVLGEGIPLLAAACIGATVFLVLPQGMGAAARRSLARFFTVPEYQGKTS